MRSGEHLCHRCFIHLADFDLAECVSVGNSERNRARIDQATVRAPAERRRARRNRADPTLHEKAQRKIAIILSNMRAPAYRHCAVTVAGTDGNQEFFICAQKRSA